MAEVWHHRLVTVIAPAGYGKSTAIAEFLRDTPAQRKAWLSLDERDADPVRLGRHLLAALEEASPAIGDAVAAVLDGASNRLDDRFTDALLEQLWQFRDDLVFVLEDVDRVDASLVADLSRLVLEAPTHVHFVVSARADPSLPTARLRSRGDLFEIRADDLRFTNAETQALVTAVAGVDLTADAAAHLGRRTEGWPVVVHLAALSLADRGRSDPLLAIDATERNIVDYLSAEILALESADVRSFLQDTSVLAVLDPDMCDFVTQRSDSARILDDLNRRGSSSRGSMTPRRSIAATACCGSSWPKTCNPATPSARRHCADERRSGHSNAARWRQQPAISSPPRTGPAWPI